MSSFGNWLDSSNISNLSIQTYIKGFLDISGGNVILRNNSSLYLTGGDASLGGRLLVGLDTSANGRLFLGGDASLNGRLYVGSDASLVGNLTVTKMLTASGGLTIPSGSSLNVTGVTITGINLNAYAGLTGATFTGSLTAGAGLFVAGSDASLNGRLYVGSDASLAGNLTVTKMLTASGGLTIPSGSSLNVTGVTITGINLNAYTGLTGATFTGSLTAGAGLFVAGSDASLNGRLFVSGDTSMNGNLSLGGNIIIAGNLTVKEFTNNNIINTLTTNVFSISEDLSLNGRIMTSSDASFGGNVMVKNGLTVTGAISVPANSIPTSAITGITAYATLAGASFSAPVYGTTVATTSAITAGGLVTAGSGLTVVGAITVPANSIPTSAITGIASYATLAGASFTGTFYGNTIATTSSITAGGLVTAGSGLTVVGAITVPANSIPTSAITGIASYATLAGATFTGTVYTPALISSGLHTATGGLTVTGAVSLPASTIAGASFTAPVYGTTVATTSAITSGGLVTAGSGLTVTGAITVPANSIPTSAITGITAYATLAGATFTGTVYTPALISSGLHTATGGLTVTGAVSLPASTIAGASFTAPVYGTTVATTSTITSGGLVTANSGLTVVGAITVPANSIPTSAITGITAYATLTGATFTGTVYTPALISSGLHSANGGLSVVNSDASLNGRLFVSGDSSMNGNLSLGGNIVIAGNLTVKEFTNNNIINTLTTNVFSISEDISLNGRIMTSSDASFSGNLMVKNGLTVTGAISVPANSIPTSAITGITAYATLAGSTFTGTVYTPALISSGLHTATGGLTVTNDASLNGRLYVGGDASFNGNLIVPTNYISVGRAEDDGSMPTTGVLRVGGNSGTGTYLQIKKSGGVTWNTVAYYDATRYINCTGNAENAKDFNVGPGGVGIGYAPPLYARGGSDGLYVNGNVGIGTTSPIQLLDINSTSSATAAIRLCCVPGGSAGYIMSGFNSGVNSYVGIQSGANTSTALSTPTFVVSNNNGNVGIGTTSPAYKLDVTGAGNFSSNLTVGGYIAITNGQSISSTGDMRLTCTSGYALYLGNDRTSGDILLNVTSSANTSSAVRVYGSNGSGGSKENFTILNSGNVGIGTTNPQGQLHLYSTLPTTTTSFPTLGHLIVDCSRNAAMGGSITVRNSGGAATAGSAASIAFEFDGSTAYANDGTDNANARIACIHEGGATNPGALAFNTWNGIANGERMRISSSGYVGIGTTSPSNFLQIQCSSATVSSIASDTASSPHGIVIRSPKTGSSPYSMGFGVDYTNGFGFINCAGNTATQNLCLQTRGANVGIGTTSPAYTLDVTGTGNFSSNLTVGGTLLVTGATTMTGNTTVNGTVIASSTNGVFYSANISGYANTGTASAYPTNRFNTIAAGDGINAIMNGNGSVYVAGQGLTLTGQSLYWGGQTATSPTSFASQIQIDGGRSALAGVNHGQIRFYTANTQQMVINEAGQVGIGTTTPSTTLAVSGTGSFTGDASLNGRLFVNADTSMNGNLKVGGNIRATSFNATSDYRVKTNVQPLDCSFNVDNLHPVTYTNTLSNKKDIGFLAHELQEEYPFLVSGEKDGETLQSINYIGLIGVLVKEIKVIKSQISSLATESTTNINELKQKLSDINNKINNV